HFTAIFYPAHYQPGSFTDSDIAVGPTVRAAIQEQPCLEDVAIGARFVEDRDCLEKFLRAWRQVDPDVLELEGPYLWASVRELIAAGTMPRPRIIYSSQNVESELKASIYEAALPRVEQADAVSRVRELEEDLVRTADLIV